MNLIRGTVAISQSRHAEARTLAHIHHRLPILSLVWKAMFLRIHVVDRVSKMQTDLKILTLLRELHRISLGDVQFLCSYVFVKLFKLISELF